MLAPIYCDHYGFQPGVSLSPRWCRTWYRFWRGFGNWLWRRFGNGFWNGFGSRFGSRFRRGLRCRFGNWLWRRFWNGLRCGFRGGFWRW
ncbi:hypothetical protein PBCV1_a042L [Paramecium bursaria Chlorella virus 1]|uniref:Uncharacterized protein n=1 Tax=Paramecium bursaria Chlorella virus 1 TaxID=10506 RepID=Q89377_PBCV1|nr:hypothetical protein PBCV1_a042L [Paramecium bursaria Chlorella virus 1]AAC96410.1 hypothetical protein [Paramecium bursaria Chlorella virus 1]